MRLLLLALSLLLAAPALAQEPQDDRARELYDNGAMLYDEGRYEDAIVAWKQAYEISERPLLLFNIANAQERIGLWSAALESLNRYRAFAPSEERETLDRRMRNIERRVEEQRAVEARESLPTTQLTTTPMNEVGASGSDGPAPGPIILMAGGLAGVGVGAGLYGGALAARTEAEEMCRTAGEVVHCPVGAAELIQQDETLSLAGDITMIAGGAVAATGLVITLVQILGGKTPKAAVLVLPSVGPGSAAVSVIGRF